MSRCNLDKANETANRAIKKAQKLEKYLKDEQDKEIERLKTELQDTKEHLGEYLHEQEEENNRLNKEVEKYKKRCYEALTLIRKNYGLLDKYGIDMLDDILNGK